MNTSNPRTVGIALLLFAVLAAIALQISGHGYVVTTEHLTAPPNLGATAVTATRRDVSWLFLSMAVPAVIGIVCLFLPMRDHSD